MPVGERTSFDNFFKTLISLDVDHAIYEVIWQKFSGPVRFLLENKYVFQPFWNYHNQVPEYDDWDNWFARNQRRIRRGLQDRDTKIILGTIFDRLYILRNQLVHGSATWNSSVNRDQLRDEQEF